VRREYVVRWEEVGIGSGKKRIKGRRFWAGWVQKKTEPCILIPTTESFFSNLFLSFALKRCSSTAPRSTSTRCSVQSIKTCTGRKAAASHAAVTVTGRAPARAYVNQLAFCASSTKIRRTGAGWWGWENGGSRWGGCMPRGRKEGK
jgi:hypothetical protein